MVRFFVMMVKMKYTEFMSMSMKKTIKEFKIVNWSFELLQFICEGSPLVITFLLQLLWPDNT